MSEVEERATQREPIFRDIRRYYCEYCGICRSKKSLLTSHILSDHQEEVKKREMELDEEGEGQNCDNTCEECGASFKKPAHLKQHMLCHSIEVLGTFQHPDSPLNFMELLTYEDVHPPQ